MKHTWGIWISFLNWIARFSSTILLSDGANKANTTWLMKCLSFIRLQFLLPKCFQSCDRTTSSVAANFTVAISLIQEDEKYREWGEIQNACTLPMRWIFSVRKFCWRFVTSLSNSYPATLSSLENMRAISLLDHGSPAGDFYGTWSQHFYDHIVLFDLFSARKRRKRNLSRNFFQELATAKTLHLWSSCKVILKLYCGLESIND